MFIVNTLFGRMSISPYLRSFDPLTGQTTTDDILGRIFSNVCIGK
jgi:tRNA U34 5-carboxymethylaminomethyl modifying GTPase MnmE/TrmE